MKEKNKWMLSGLVGCVLLLQCGPSNYQNQVNLPQTVAVEADPCDDPDANINCCFLNMPVQLTNSMIIATQNEPGERMDISGTIFKADGTTPYPNVIMYAYHTDHTGHYSKKGNETGFQKWHGYLYSWCKTDAKGQYEIHSIRPARYPDNSMPAHIHAALKEPNGSTPYYINDFVFGDDKLVTKAYLAALNDPGGNGVVTIKKSLENVWTGQRDIVVK